jgi:hypothetical protein
MADRSQIALREEPQHGRILPLMGATAPGRTHTERADTGVSEKGGGYRSADVTATAGTPALPKHRRSYSVRSIPATSALSCYEPEERTARRDGGGHADLCQVGARDQPVSTMAAMRPIGRSGAPWAGHRGPSACWHEHPSAALRPRRWRSLPARQLQQGRLFWDAPPCEPQPEPRHAQPRLPRPCALSPKRTRFRSTQSGA